jgi:Txe/YoeB family toxin of toxin-antitoxin system
MTYKVLLTKQALRDAKKLKSTKLLIKCQQLLDIIADNPFTNFPPYEKLIGDLNGYYSRRINIKHRLVYEIDHETKTLKILRMWSHYE